jgi:hypothetical protein|tara:strand:+ start:7808 stop:8482 length:675 start_codon:yes stop_codon:yes gene_type:complete
MNLINNNLQHYIDLLKSNQKFSFTRWGDGEWLCFFGDQGHNCDLHTYFPDMGRGLNEAINNPKGYLLATWPQSEPMMFRFWDQIQNTSPTEWVDASVWEEAAMAGEISPLINQLEQMNFIIVSEPSKRELPMKYTDFIEVPSTNCYLDKERIKQEIVEMCEKYDNPVFGLSASMATNVIVDELYPLIGDKCWMIDFGSIWEPFLNNPVHSRSYHRRYKTKQLKY